MILDVGTTCADDPTTEQQAGLEVLLQDPDWVETQFSEIVEGAGLDDRVTTVGMAHTPPAGRRERGGDGPRRGLAEPNRRTGFRSRVRSPPVTSRTEV
jgi:hypothetical protein